MNRPTWKKHLQRAVDIAGGQAPLARKLSDLTGRRIRQSHIYFWLGAAKKFPADVADALQIATDGEVTKRQICPGVFSTEPTEAA